MQPTTSRDYQKAALQRLTTAEVLLGQRLNLDAQYLGGYPVECSLKALILAKTPAAEQAETLASISSGAKMHRPDVLLGKLRDLGVFLPLDLAKKMRRFDWMPGLRYETGRRDTGETIALSANREGNLRLGGGAVTVTKTAAPAWEAKRTDETRMVEDVLRKAGFDQVDAYRYNAASIRVRVIDQRFEGMAREERDGLVEPHLEQLPERTQADIVTLFTFAPSELQQAPKTSREFMLNVEFEDPSPSVL